MRILQVIHQFPPERVGGTEIYALGLAQKLSARDHDCAIFHRVPSATELELGEWDKVPVFRAGSGPMTPWSVFRATFGNRALHSAFAQTLEAFRPDLIHIQHLMGLPVSIVELVKQRNIPLVMTLHDYWFICANAQLLTNYDQTVCQGPRFGGMNCARCALARAGLGALWPLSPALVPLFTRRRRLLQQVLDSISLMIAPSRFLMNELTKSGAPAERMVHVPNGIDVLGAQPRVKNPRESLRYAYIGGLAPQKGVHVLIEAFNMLQDHATLEIYGDMDQFQDYARSLQEQVRSPQITFGGRLDRADVWRILSEIDALLLPSLWYENAPVVIQEAFAAGVPVIASDLGAISEWVRDGVNGLLVQPGNADAWRFTLTRTIQDPGLLVELSANIRPGMSVDEHVKIVESHYVDLVNNRVYN